jgi:hypothetical protein
MQNTFKYALSATVVAMLVACGGGGDDSSKTVTPVTPSIPPPTTPEVKPLSENIDRKKSQWLISTSTSSLDGIKTTQMFAPGPGGANFFIYCKSNGERGFYIQTEFVTGSGAIQYRIGHNPVQNQTWRESAAGGFRTLTPPLFDINLLKQIYQSWDFLAQLDKFGSGPFGVGFRTVGFPAAIDKTRDACGWSVDTFPPDNGWSTDYPDIPPSGAVQATYDSAATSQFGLIAWRAVNPAGRPQILVRLGENKTLCKGSTVINDQRLYVVQDGKRVAATSGVDFSLSCPTDLPATFALQGDFDASRPLTINAYPFHFNTINPGTPFATLILN